jgi:asparagine synthase (glutamine-hydrolysing)
MSGICGLLNLDGRPVAEGEILAMTSLLERRGPEGTETWCDGEVGLGHTLLTATPEAAHERLPLRHHHSGCVITADVRLDNRDELLGRLSLHGEGTVGDGEIILAAYLHWGESCLDHLLGDFAFAIWDPRGQTLFCARDQMGMKQLCYHHGPHRMFAFASSPKAVVTLPQVPYRINEGRIADFLTGLEAIDWDSTFYEDVFRLPPAHALRVTPNGLRVWRYWRLEPGDVMSLPSDKDYEEALLDAFIPAVERRLRGAPRVGSMLSGGMDSGSVVAVASELLAASGAGPLTTVSAVSPESETCVETRTIHQAVTVGGLKPHFVSHDHLDRVPELLPLTRQADEPGDAHMTLVRAVCIEGRRAGLKAMLDGAAGDVVLNEADHVSRLLLAGRLMTAYREIVGQQQFYGLPFLWWRDFGRRVGATVTPLALKRIRNTWRARGQGLVALRDHPLQPDFAQRVSFGDRYATQRDRSGFPAREAYTVRRRASVEHLFLALGRERYDRVASAIGVEPRDPFVDLQFVRFVSRLPGDQLLRHGWPKAILRRAMAGRLPASVRYRRGKEHLGWAFTNHLRLRAGGVRRSLSAEDAQLLAPYVDLDRVSWHGAETREVTYAVEDLAAWLGAHKSRPGS